MGLLAGTMLMGPVTANAEHIVSGWFEAVESGINHKEMPVDSHHICGVGNHTLWGHYTACLALETPTKCIIEYMFVEGDAIYGTVELKQVTKAGLSNLNITFTKGTGRFRHVSGHASGFMKSAAKDRGVQTYIVRLKGYVDTIK